MRNEPTILTEELRLIEMKLKTLRRDYEQYFLGSRPREPANARAEIQKVMIRLSNGVIKNTAERFKFQTINQMFMTYKRRWDDTLRKIENGTYQRHVFKANLHDRARNEAAISSSPADSPADTRATPGSADEDIFNSYIEAAKTCGQNVKGLTPAKLQSVIDKQAAAIKKKLGVKDVTFRVEVVDGQVKLKARAVKAS
ncbi:MAG: hypothetical protein IH881_09410 [Myxococcales bacterium]|nr:hypothetical protein [Myxococcales bacterium]